VEVTCCKIWCLFCFSSISNCCRTSIFIKNKICSNWLGRWISQTLHFLSDHWYSSPSDMSSHSRTKWNRRKTS
jgi:hypothetical protein